MEQTKIVDWSKHELIVRKYKSEDGIEISEYTLKKTDTWLNSVVFCNHNNICSVTGDYSNWIFDRQWNPENPKTSIDAAYWYEKLRISSIQEFDIDVEECVKLYLQMRDEFKREYPEWFDEESSEYDERLVGFFNDVEQVYDDFEYCSLINNYSDLDILDEPYMVRKYPTHFMIIIEAFCEMVKRLNNKE